MLPKRPPHKTLEVVETLEFAVALRGRQGATKRPYDCADGCCGRLNLARVRRDEFGSLVDRL